MSDVPNRCCLAPAGEALQKERPMSKSRLRAVLAGGVLLTALAGALRCPIVAAANGAVGPSGTRGPSRAERLKLAVNHLTGEQIKQLRSSDWISRCVAMVGLSQMPTDEATEALVAQLLRERHPIGQLVAWQAVLARADRLSDKQYASFKGATWRMAKSDVFHGDLRIGLLEVISSAPVTYDGRAVFKKYFARTSSLDSSDIPTLIAMGRALRAWGDRSLAEYVIGMLGSPNTAVRAELVLQAAGASVPWNRTPKAKQAYTDWWRKARAKFTARKPGAGAWKKLKPQFIAAPRKMSSFDPDDRTLLQQLELGRLHLNRLDFAIALDCSRSMRAEILRLKRDIRIMFSAFKLIAREVGVGVTLFAPGGMVEHLPLTSSFSRLTAYINAVDIMGPAGEEEWAGALEKAMKGSRWGGQGKYSRRAIVLISDEPITAAQFARAMPLAQAGAKAGFRIYGVKIRSLTNVANNPLSVPFDRTMGDSVFAGGGAGGGRGGRGGGWGHYETLAKATGGRAIDVAVPQGGLGVAHTPAAGGKGGKKGRAKKRGGGKKPPAGNTDPMAIAPVYPGGGPTNQVLTLVLTDAIHPLYGDRVEPFVKILVSYCQKAALHTPEKRTWAPPGPMEPNR